MEKKSFAFNFLKIKSIIFFKKKDVSTSENSILVTFLLEEI